jgi:transcription initiation factor IIE alpha subunit
MNVCNHAWTLIRKGAFHCPKCGAVHWYNAQEKQTFKEQIDERIKRLETEETGDSNG